MRKLLFIVAVAFALLTLASYSAAQQPKPGCTASCDCKFTHSCGCTPKQENSELQLYICGL